MIRKGFTFAELMISLVVIAVITAILYPTISELAPNNNKHLFRSAYKTIELVVSEITTNLDTGVPQTAAELCKQFKMRLNFIGDGACTNTNCACDNDGFQTSNGMRWYFGANGEVYVDVNASNNRTDSSCDEADYQAPAAADWNDGSFCAAGNAVVTDTFRVQVSDVGRINVVSPIGRQHLLEETED